jgi:hypothetical protein
MVLGYSPEFPRRERLPEELRKKIEEVRREIFKEGKEIRAEDLLRKIREVGSILEKESKEGEESKEGAFQGVRTLEDLKRRHIEKPTRDGSFVALPGEGKVLVVGDIHGDAQALRSITLEFLERLEKGEKVYLLFLGDYSDRGLKQTEVINIILTLKSNFPENVVLLRGNHELKDIAARDGTLFELVNRFGQEKGREVFDSYADLFDKLAVVAAGDETIFLHGAPPVDGLPKEGFTRLDDQTIIQIIWNDPTLGMTINSPRGAGYLVNTQAIQGFLKNIGAKRLVRGHEAIDNPQEYGEYIITIFSTGKGSEDTAYPRVTPRILELDLKRGEYEIKDIDLEKGKESIEIFAYEPPREPFPYVPPDIYAEPPIERPAPEESQREQLERLRGVLEGIMERERQRFIERYGVGALGWLSSLFERLGPVGISEKIRSADNWLKRVTAPFSGILHRVGRIFVREGEAPRVEFQEEDWRGKRWGKILLRTLGGLGLVAYSVFSGTGVLTPFVWVEGLRQAAMGITEALQEIKGMERGQEEVQRYRELVDAINSAVEKAQRGELTEEDIRLIFEREKALAQRQEESRKIEERDAKIRAWVGSGVATAVSLAFGVPLGRHFLKGPPPGLETAMSEGHRIIGKFFGESMFLYGPGELQKVSAIAQSKGWPLTVLSWLSQPGHVIGHELFGLPKSLLLGSQIYNLARGFLDHLLARRGKISIEEEYAPPQTYAPEYPYLPPEYPYLPPQVSPPKERPLLSPAELPRERLKEAKENAGSLIDSYFEKARENPEYQSEFDDLVEGLPKEPPKPETKLIIAIPAHVSEHKNIKDALEAIAKELKGKKNIKPEEAEIVIFVNANNKISQEDFENSLREFQERVEEFRKNNPEINIIVVSRKFKEAKPIGFIRKLATDLALLRSREVISQTKRSPIILSIDADIKGFRENYIDNALAIMEEQELGLLSGAPEIGDPEKFRQFPVLLAAQRLWDFVKLQFGTRRWPARFPYTVGAGGIFIRPEVYALAGGFDENVTIAEDLALGDTVYRNGIPYDVYSLLRVYTSHRRSADQLASEESFVNQWSQWSEKDQVRYPETLEEAERKLREMGLEGKDSLENENFLRALEREANDVTLALMIQLLRRPSERRFLGIKNWKDFIITIYKLLHSAFVFWGLDKYEFQIGDIIIRWEKKKAEKETKYEVEYEYKGRKYTSIEAIPGEYFVLDNIINPGSNIAYGGKETFRKLKGKIKVKIEQFETLKNNLKRVLGF